MSKIADLKKAVHARLTADGQLSDRLGEIEQRRNTNGVTSDDLIFINHEHARLGLELFAVVIDTDDGPFVAQVPGWGSDANVFADLIAAEVVAMEVRVDTGHANDVRVYKLVEVEARRFLAIGIGRDTD